MHPNMFSTHLIITLQCGLCVKVLLRKYKETDFGRKKRFFNDLSLFLGFQQFFCSGGFGYFEHDKKAKKCRKNIT